MRPGWRAIGLVCGATVLLLAYLLLLTSHLSDVAGGADSSGYLNAGRGFASGHIVRDIPILRDLALDSSHAVMFIPLGYVRGTVPGTMVPSYPPGLPLHNALAILATGSEAAPFLISPLAAVAAMLLLYALSREVGLSRLSSFCGGLMFGICPTVIFQAVQPMSDVLASTYAILAILAALRSERRRGWAVTSGVAFGVGVMVRPTNILLLIPLLIAFGWKPRKLFLFALGALPFAITMMGINQVTFGDPLVTGYGSFREMLELGNFPIRFRHYLYWLAALMSFVVMPGGLVVIFLKSASLRIRAVLAGWFVPFFLFYTFYGPYETWWYTRFLLPAVPSLILGALLVLEDIDRRVRGVAGSETGRLVRRVRLPEGLPTAVATLLVVMTGSYHVRAKGILGIGEGERVYVKATSLVRQHVPERSIVVAMQLSGSLLYYNNRNALRWDFVEPDQYASLAAHAFNERYEWYALLSDFEEKEFFRRFPGSWRSIDHVRHMRLWKLVD
ncbi:MAG TPA: glycosyltransferase family 39 protein [Thermoanaerobaculia bacterium]|nr:glycosyltransferase family 39 protein [Thermoanaerobaculia bacterium]